MIDNKSIVTTFVKAISVAVESQSSLVIAMSNFGALELEAAHLYVSGMDWSNSVPKRSKYDYVVADLPIGMSRETIELGSEQINIRRNWAELSKALPLINENGVCLALVEPPAFGIAEGPRYLEALSREGYYLNGIFNPPEGLFASTSIRPVLVVFSKSFKSEVFVGELESDAQAKQLASAFITNAAGNSLSHGIYIKQGTFTGFGSLKAAQQLTKLETQYKEYDSVRLGEIVKEVSMVKSGESHQEKPNSVYIPVLGTSCVVHDIALVSVKHHNVFQVVLSDKADSEYLSAFFKSDLGRLVLSSLTSGAVIQKIRKQDLLNIRVALPRIEEQREIAFTHRRLTSLTEAITNFQIELALNPRSAAAIKGQLENMLEQIGGLTDSDKVMNMVRSGESKTAEFKESFGLDIRKGTKEKYIELAALKTLVAFLNTNGGILIVGVSDSGEVLGIETEVEKFHKSNDAFLLYFKNQLKERIGEQYYPFINHRLVSVLNRKVLMVECGESSKPCYLDGRDFYVRTNPATDKLEGPKLVEYVQNHFV